MESKIFEYARKNVKYIIAVTAGVVLLLVSSVGIGTKTCSVSEKELKNTLEMVEGVGNVEVMITYKDGGAAEGVIIVADGAADASVKKTIHDCASAVLDVPDHKIQVMSKKYRR